MFKGRIGRADYWKAIVLLLAILIVFYAIFFGALYAHINAFLFAGIAFAFGIGMFIVAFVQLGLSVRRFHDFNLSWGFILLLILLSVIPTTYWHLTISQTISLSTPPPEPIWLITWQILLIIISLGTTLWPGTPGVNKYGAPEKYRSWWAALVGKHEASFTQSMPSSFPDTYSPPPAPPAAPQ